MVGRSTSLADVEAFHDGVAPSASRGAGHQVRGDYERASALVATYGTTFDAGLRDEVVAQGRTSSLAVGHRIRPAAARAGASTTAEQAATCVSAIHRISNGRCWSTLACDDSPSRFVGVLGLLAVGRVRDPAPEAGWLGTPDPVAPGVDFFRNNDSSSSASVGPIAVFLVRVDPGPGAGSRACSRTVGARRRAVADIARRHQAIVAVNGGYFNRANGEPTGLLKVDGELVSDSSLARGVVIVHAPAGGTTTWSSTDWPRRCRCPSCPTRPARERFRSTVSIRRASGVKPHALHPNYYPDTDTAPTGTEWVLVGTSARRPRGTGGLRSARRFQRDGVVLSYGGTRLPPNSMALRRDRCGTGHHAGEAPSACLTRTLDDRVTSSTAPACCDAAAS